MSARGMKGVALFLVVLAAAAPLDAQERDDAFADEQTAELFAVAQEAWRSVDDAVVRYTARVQQRLAAAIRTPLRDRTIFQSETAARIFWDRDHDQITQVLASSAEVPGPGEVQFGDDFGIGDGFDPGGDRLVFGFSSTEEAEEIDEGDFYIVHPLGSLALDAYRYEIGDTLTLTLPDARALQAVELSVVPRRAGPNYVTGTLWIEPSTGALVRAVYRLSQQLDIVRDIPDVAEEEAAGEFDMVPGILKPWTFDMTLVTVDYTLWDFSVWLPRAMRVEGQVRVGVLKVPAEVDIAYRIESVVTEDDLAEGPADPVFGGLEERAFETREEAMAFIAGLLGEDEGVEFEVVGDNLVPVDRAWLADNPNLPPPIWEDAPGFLSKEDLDEFEGMLGDLPRPPVQARPLRAGWGLSRPDALRYNRVEALSAGVAGDARFGSFLGPIDVNGRILFGVADLEPKARLSFERNSYSSRVALSGYRDLQAVDPRGRYLGFGNSVNAFLFGRDDGEYFMASGADLRIGPSAEERESWGLRFYGERQRSVATNTDVALAHLFDSSWRFRPNVTSTELDEFGAELSISPWWGRDPEGVQGGVELYLQGAGWTAEGLERSWYGRARTTVRTRIPITERWRVGVEVEGGMSHEFEVADQGFTALPAQRQWFIGGATTLRGYDASILRGEDFGRARLEIARGALTLFGDAGWAGAREDFEQEQVLYAAGVGLSILDGLIRMDLSQGLRGSFTRTRFDLYLDAIL